MATKKQTNTPTSAPNNKEAKLAALATAIKDIKKQYGEGAVMMMDDDSVQHIEALSTGALTLDIALGIGGLPRGRIVEIYGPEGSGKSTLALHCVAEAQKLGGLAAYIDIEHAMDANYARNIGVNIEETIIAQPESGEEALDIAECIIRSNAVDIVVIDSVAALVPRQEIEGDMSDQQVGVQARLMSKAMRKLTAAIKSSNTVCIFINQIREKVGVMYGNPETTSGGRALKFFASVRLEIRRKDTIKGADGVAGNRVKVKVVKNKVAPPFKEAEFDIIFGKGVDYVGELLDIGADNDIITKSGAFYSYEGTRLGQGRENSKAFLLNNQELLNEINTKVRDLILHNKTVTVANEDDDDLVQVDAEDIE